MLVLRPRGLFGGPVAAGAPVTAVEAPAVPGGVPAAAPRGRLGRAVRRPSCWLLLAAVPLLLAPFATTTLTRILVFALFAVSLDLLVGVTGLPSLGHAGYFGAGAYAAGWVSINVTAEAPYPLLAGLGVGALAAALTGWITVRSHGVYFLMLTLAIGETLQQLADSWESVTGGANGLTGVPAVRVAGTPLANAGFTYWYVLAVGAIGFGLVWLVARSPFGTALRGIRDNEPRMRALGYATARDQVRGVRDRRRGRRAGRLAAGRPATPGHPGRPGVHHGVLRAARSDHRRRRVAVGGLPRRGTGGAGPGRASGPAWTGTARWCSAWCSCWWSTCSRAAPPGCGCRERRSRDERAALHRAEPLVRRAQGRARRRPRGRGRRPARPDRAQRGRQVHAVQADHRHAAGGRRHGRAGRPRRHRAVRGAAFPDRDEPDPAARQPVPLDDRAGDGRPRHPAPRRVADLRAPAARGAPLRAKADELLVAVGLGERTGVPVPALSHGERKQLEVALALACRPRLLLLDEPAAGMSPAERARLVRLLRTLPPRITLLFVEHDLDLVFALADRVSVLHLGRLLLTGTPEEVRASAAVREAYLGSARREELFLAVSYLSVRDLVSGYDRSTVLNGLDLDLRPRRRARPARPQRRRQVDAGHDPDGAAPPTSGSVQLDGVELAGRRPDQIARAGVAVVPQGRRVWASLTVAEHLALVARRGGARPTAAAAGPSTACWGCCPGSPSAAGPTPASSPAGSSRCWPWPARC